MKHNTGYRQDIGLSLCEGYNDPTPTTRQGTASMVARFYSLRGSTETHEVMGGGNTGDRAYWSPLPSPTAEYKKPLLEVV